MKNCTSIETRWEAFDSGRKLNFSAELFWCQQIEDEPRHKSFKRGE